MGHTTPLTTRKWLIALAEHLESIDPNFITWWEQGYVMAKQLVATPTPTHSVALRDGAVRVHSFEEPITIDIFVDSGIPRGIAPLSAMDEKRIIVAPESCRSVDRKLASTMLSTVTVRAVRRDWARRSINSGLILLGMLHAHGDEVGPFANTAIAGKLQRLMDGLRTRKPHRGSL